MRSVVHAIGVVLVAACGARVSLDVPLPQDASVPVIDAGPDCQGLACKKDECEGGLHTSIRGTVYAPNGTLPLSNVLVYVPNAPLKPLATGPSCGVCNAEVSGSPIVRTLSDAEGNFEIEDIPSGTEVPLVIQSGKWRRSIVVPKINACEPNKLPEGLVRLPKRRTEGDIPKIAVSLSWCDPLGCAMRRLGLDESEFGVSPTGTQRITVYRGTGYIKLANIDPTMSFYNDAKLMKPFDQFVLACECDPAYMQKVNPHALLEYLDAGGWVLGTHYESAWFDVLDEFKPLAKLAPTQTSPPFKIDTNVPSGKLLADWLMSPAVRDMDKYQHAEMGGPATTWIPEVAPSVQRFVTDTRGVPLSFWFYTPLNQTAKRCGRFIYADPPHMAAEEAVTNFPTCDKRELTQWEKFFAFLLFENTACLN